MVLLQEAMVAGVVFLIVGAASILIGIPVLTYIVNAVLSRKNTAENSRKERTMRLLKSLLISIVIVVIVLFIVLRLISSSLVIS